MFLPGSGFGSGFQISLDLIKTLHKIDRKFSRQMCLDPVLKNFMDPVCPERLYPDPDPQPCRRTDKVVRGRRSAPHK